MNIVASKTDFLTASKPSFASSDIKPFRPIQYLGSKLRVLEDICAAACWLAGPGGRVADLFTGSTVVAQALAAKGYIVSTADTQLFSSILSRACLSIGRGINDECDPELLDQVSIPTECINRLEAWKPHAGREQEALRDCSAEKLSGLNTDLPLSWRAENPFGAASTISQFSPFPLLTSVYAGSYFGVKQALELDKLRLKIGLAKQQGLISVWQEAAYIAALLSAASAVVHSAGKHFAQPLNAGTVNNSAFNNQRLLQDRKLDVVTIFRESCQRIDDLKFPQGHSAYNLSAEQVLNQHGHEFDLVYLDPPYTSQQYSRFYHILETMCTYQIPDLLHAGKITSGLYPVDRYKSEYCSKVKAPRAMRRTIELCKKSKASIIISYSVSANGSDGNARMISLEQILGFCREFYGSQVECTQLKHQYRQFNANDRANVGRADAEVLITCKNG